MAQRGCFVTVWTSEKVFFFPLVCVAVYLGIKFWVKGHSLLVSWKYCSSRLICQLLMFLLQTSIFFFFLLHQLHFLHLPFPKAVRILSFSWIFWNFIVLNTLSSFIGMGIQKLFQARNYCYLVLANSFICLKFLPFHVLGSHFQIFVFLIVLLKIYDSQFIFLPLELLALFTS